MKNEVLYKFEVVENIGEDSKNVFGKVGTRCTMKEDGFAGLDGSYWKYETFKELSTVFDGVDIWQTKFKLVEPYKIDLCKIIGVEELQEFKVANLVADYKIKNNSLMFRNEKTDDWAYSTMYINDFIEFINEHEIEILPKFERLKVNEHVDYFLKKLLEEGYKWITRDGYNDVEAFKTEPIHDGKCYIADNGCEIELTIMGDEIPLIFEMRVYSLEKHFESEGK